MLKYQKLAAKMYSSSTTDLGSNLSKRTDDKNDISNTSANNKNDTSINSGTSSGASKSSKSKLDKSIKWRSFEQYKELTEPTNNEDFYKIARRPIRPYV